MPKVRLTTTIDPAVDQRLRALANLTRKPIGQILSELLDRALPQTAELAGRMAAALGVMPAPAQNDQPPAVPALAESVQPVPAAGR